MASSGSTRMPSTDSSNPLWIIKYMSPVAIKKKMKVKRENIVGSSTVMSNMKSYNAV
jgi:hypothetical protein